jgi:HK97 family phage prohead protease
MERRVHETTELRVERREEGKTTRIAGYAAVFESESVDLGGFTERIAKGAFAGSLKGDIRALWNHDTNQVLGRTSAGTLRLAEDGKGLAMELDPPDTQSGRDAVTLVERRDVTGMSFAFRTISDNWAKVAGKWLRTLLEVEISEVSICAFPAYPATEVGIRAAVDAKDAIEALRLAKSGEVARFAAEHAARERRLRLVGRGLIVPPAVDRRAAFQRFLSRWQEEHRDASFQDKIEAVWYALYDLLGSPWAEAGSYWYIVATFPDRVIIETTPGKLFAYPIVFAADNTVTIGAPMAVEVQYTPIAAEGAA